MAESRNYRTVANTEDNKKKCICPGCPSYPYLCEGELLFCATGKSGCTIDINGCICYSCPVYLDNNLIGLYFCDKERVGESKSLIRRKRHDESESFFRTMVEIKDIAKAGKSVIGSMGSLKKLPFSFNDLHFIPAQVAKIPLNREDNVNTEVLIGPKSKKPLKVASPILISGMSFGAVSKNVRLIICETANENQIGFNSGEGGVLKEELESKYLIGQYSTGRFGITDDLLSKFSAVEIRFGQGAYPGKGSFLPSKKMTPEIAEIRGLKKGVDAYSPAHHPDMKTKEQIAEKVSWLKEVVNGPVGAKIGCGNVEDDIGVLLDADVDFISIDGFGGGTGATDMYVRENVGIPLVAALPRASMVLEEFGVGKGASPNKKVTLIAGGGLRNSADFAKCLALGADAVYVGTAALIAINCEQYRICYTGSCPTGVTSQKPYLAKQLEVEEGIKRLGNFLRVSTFEISNFARIVGKDDINDLKRSDLISLSRELSEVSRVRWLV